MLNGLKRKNTNLRKNPNSSGVAQVTKAAIYIKMLILFRVQIQPLFIQQLYRAPSVKTGIYPKLHTVGMATESNRYFGLLA